MGPIPAAQGPRSDARFATPEAQALASAPQHDKLPDTVFDAERCGPASIVAAAILDGRPSVQRLVDGLRSARDRGVGLRSQPMAELDSIASELQRGQLSPQSVQRLQDYLFASVARSRESATNGIDARAMADMAGLRSRAWAVPQDVSGPMRGDLIRSNVQRNEATSVRLDLGAEGSHMVLFGRDARGREFVFDSDSGGSRALLRAPADSRAISDLMRNAVQLNGGRIIQLR